MKKRTLAMILCIAILLPMLLQSVPAVFADGRNVTILHQGESVRKLTLPYTEKDEVTVQVEGFTPAGYQWQILADAGSDLWVDIMDKTDATCEISYPLIKNLLYAGSAFIRCAVATGDEEVYSNTLKIVADMTEPEATSVEAPEAAVVAPAPLPAPVAVDTTVAVDNTVNIQAPVAQASLDEDPMAPVDGDLLTEDVSLESADVLAAEEDSDIADETADIFTITIEYVYSDSSEFDGQRVALPYIAEIASGQTLDKSIDSPTCVGYTPAICSNSTVFNADTYVIDLSKLGAITSNVSITVEYSPAVVSYTVRHYLQNVDDDEYTWVDTTMTTGYTEALTSDDAANTYTGFTALSHYHEKIAADSSTMIDIYYDRNYYLMSFDLDGGYGVEPIYARYGAAISIGTPYKAGWTFVGWDGTIPSTMPSENKTYTASWGAQTDINFTVAYWLEDANTDGKYNFWGFTTQSGTAGDTVQGEDYKDYSAIADSLDTYEKRYSYYDHADSDVVIKGDGSTVVNVYYDQNEYTLKFYYAARTGSEGAYTYKIYGGSTYFFGASNGYSYNSNELDLLNAIYTDGSYDHQWGEITEAPELNVLGTRRNYTTGADTKNGVDYLYLSFTAKYGADISALWPCNVFESATRSDASNDSGWSGTEAFVSAWNGEHHVYYSQHNSNQTIKGNYNELDYQLLWDYTKYGDAADKTVAYLCFWENGSGDVNWNIPELYRYNIYVPVLTGQEDNQTEDGKCYLWATYDTCDNSTVGEQTAPAINGYTYTGNYTSQNLASSDTSILYDENGSRIYNEAHAVNFFYTRDQYKLTFVNGDTIAQESMVYFDAAISTLAPTVKYFDNNLADMYVFGGWYTSPNAVEGSEFDLTDAKMPSSALSLYAKWNLITHNVNIYLTADGAESGTNQIGSTIAVTHDEPVPTASHPDTSTLKHPADESATFIGWFYKDKSGNEQAFDFATMTITADMNIYAKWRSNVMKQVEISYVVVNDDGTTTQIAETESLMLRLGQTRTFEAKTGSSLYAEYRTGCFPTTASHSITITEDDIASTEPVTFTFEYKEYGSVPYQVEFYVLELDGALRPAFKAVTETVNGEEVTKAQFVEYGNWNDDYKGYIEEHWQNDKAVVTELYVPDDLADQSWVLPDEYLPNALKIQKIIVPSNTEGVDPEKDITANVIQFIYTYTEPEIKPDDSDNPNPGTPVYKARYLVQHFIQSSTDLNDYTTLYSWSDKTGLSGETASASPIDIPGYTYSYDVTNANKQGGTTLGNGADGETNTEDDILSGIITADDSLELNFYYTVNSYPYQVMYLEQDTNRVLATTKTTNSDGDQLTGLYGSKVTEEAITIEGYDIVDSSTKTIYIQMEAGDTASVNTIVFYYKLKSAELVISKNVELDEEQADQEGISQIPSWVYDQDFVFTIYQPKGFPKSVYHYTFTDAKGNSEELTVNAGVQTIEISLKHGEKAQFHDFPMGTYTVTETYVPGFKATVDNYIAQAHSVTLDTDGETKTLQFINYFPFYTGDLVIKKNVTKLDESDPSATDPYKVTVVLEPDKSAREVNRTITFVDQDGNALNDANGNSSFTIPNLTGTDDQTEFTIELLVPVGGEVKMVGVPVGSFTATEEVKGTIGYIYDFYTVKYNKAVHENDEVRGTSHIVSGSIHGGHPTAVTFNNTYKKGDLTINKTVTQEYENDNWDGDTFTFEVTGTTELPVGNYEVVFPDGTKEIQVTAGNNGNIVNVGTVSIDVTKADTITTNNTDTVVNGWGKSFKIENLPAGFYTVTETSSKKGLSLYTISTVVEPGTGLVNDTIDPAVFTFNNKYKRTTGNLMVEKKIDIVTPGFEIKEDQPFTFRVRLTDGILRDAYTCEIKSTNGTDDTSDDTQVENSVTKLSVQKVTTDGTEDIYLEFNLKHNEYILISDLPIGQYTIEELAVSGYDDDLPDLITIKAEDNNTAAIESTKTVLCTNKYPIYVRDLIITRKNDEPGQVFVYKVSGHDLSIDVTLVIGDEGTGSVTIADLPYDPNNETIYTVTEQKNWSWRYESNSDNVDMTPGENETQKTPENLQFDGGSTLNKWLSGNSNMCHNTYTAGGG